MAQAKSTSLNDQIFEHFQGAKTQLKGLPPARRCSRGFSCTGPLTIMVSQEISTSSPGPRQSPCVSNVLPA